jgi:hypothetical protein
MSPAILILGEHRFVQAADGIVVAFSFALWRGSVQATRQ